MEELINQISVKITSNQTEKLMTSKIDLDYAYGQLKLSKETSRKVCLQCVQLMLQFQKGIFLFNQYLDDIDTDLYRTLEYPTAASLNDIIVVRTPDTRQVKEKLNTF